jgi:CDP-diacylglycerol---glycerol-3-phosphate 3-phosphatidyltransferase
MNLPNKITVLRVLMIPFFLLFLLGNFFDETTSRYIAIFIFITASATDALDGYIARSRNLTTNLGKFMDPLADKLLVCSALIAMVELGDIPSWVVIIIIAREFTVTGFRIVAASENIVISAGFWGKIKTIVQMAMIVALLFKFQNEYYRMFANSLIIASVVLTVISGIEYIYSNIEVLKESK